MHLADRAYVPGYRQASKRDMDQYRTSPFRPGQPGRRLRGIRPRASGGSPPPASGVSSAQEDTRMRLARGTRDRTLSPVRLRALPAVRMQASLGADLDAAVPAASSVDLHVVNT